jgi:mRNA-binding protein PUF3
MEENLQQLSLTHAQSHEGQFPAPFYPSNNHVRTPVSGQLIERPPQSIGYFTPESASTFANYFPSRQLELQRGTFTPAASDLRPSYFSAAATPGALDGSISASSQVGRTNAAKLLADPVALELRLRSLQQQRHANGSHLQQFQPHLQTNLNLYRHHLGGYADMAALQQALASGVLLGNNMMPPQMPMYTGQLNYPMLDAPHSSRQEVHRTSVISALLSEFKASASRQDKDSKNQHHQHNQYSQPARQWHLRDVEGHVAEFCGDQQGSRFIQNKLEQANSDEKEMVFKEIMPDLVALMQDVFGNYVVQKFFDHGDMRQKAEMANAMKGNLFKLSKQMYACRVVQKAIDHILTTQRVELINELKYDIVELSTNMNGNHVIQKAVEAIPASQIPFMITAFSNHCHDLSTHMYGCRVIQRVLEYCDESVKREILDKLHAADDLIDDQYGNYVTQHMIEYGNEQDKKLVNQTLIKNIIHFSTHKFASNVVEKCFEFADEQTKQDMMMAIVDHIGPQGNGLTHFSRDQFGNYVIRELCSISLLVMLLVVKN